MPPDGISTASEAPAATSEQSAGQTDDARGGASPGERQAPLTHAERRANLLSRLREGGALSRPGQAPQPPQTEDSAPKAIAGQTEEASPSKGGEATEVSRAQEPRNEERDLELKLSRMTRELRDARADALEAKKKTDAHDALVRKLEQGRGDPHALVAMLPELFGKDFGQIADWIVENEQSFREKQRYAQLPPDVREELELAKRERLEKKDREEREGRERAESERFTSYRDSAQRFIEDNHEDYPLVHATSWAADQIARAALSRGTRDARPLLDELEKNLRTELTGALGNAGVIASLIKGDAELAAKVRQALGVSPEPNKSHAAASLRSGPNATDDGVSSLSNGVTASDVAGSYSARAARKARIAEALKARLYGGR